MSHLGGNKAIDSIESAEPGEETYLSIRDRADGAAHAVAAHERREAFAGWSILDQPGDSQPSQRERRFVGAHSDVGGGYTDSDVSDAALMWMIKQARQQGGLLASAIDKEKIEQDDLNKIQNPTVHDEVGNVPYLLRAHSVIWMKGPRATLNRSTMKRPTPKIWISMRDLRT